MYKVFAQKVQLRENKGMYLNVFEKIISNKAFPFKVVKKLKNVSPHKAGKLITKNRILMLATQTKNRDHLSLVVAKSPHTLTFVNQYLNVPVVSKFYKKDMKKHFRNNIIYVIEKKSL